MSDNHITFSKTPLLICYACFGQSQDPGTLNLQLDNPDKNAAF